MWLDVPWAFHPGPAVARLCPGGASASSLAKPLVENVIATVVFAAQGRPGRLRRQAHVLLAWPPGPRPRSPVPLLSHSCSPAPWTRLPHGGSASIPRNWLVCAQPAAPDGTHVGRTESADPISYEIAETIRGDPCEVEQAVREHAGLCIDMRADEILISACAVNAASRPRKPGMHARPQAGGGRFGPYGAVSRRGGSVRRLRGQVRRRAEGCVPGAVRCPPTAGTYPAGTWGLAAAART